MSTPWRKMSADAKNIHGRTLPFEASEILGPVSPVGLACEAESGNPARVLPVERASQASCWHDARRALSYYVSDRRPRRALSCCGGAKSSIASNTPASLSTFAYASR